jgi:hypothetical protein
MLRVMSLKWYRDAFPLDECLTTAHTSSSTLAHCQGAGIALPKHHVTALSSGAETKKVEGTSPSARRRRCSNGSLPFHLDTGAVPRGEKIPEL